MFHTTCRILMVSVLLLGSLATFSAIDPLQAQPLPVKPLRPALPPRTVPAPRAPVANAVRTMPQISSGYIGNMAGNSLNNGNSLQMGNQQYSTPFGSSTFGGFNGNMSNPFVMSPNGFNPGINGNGFNNPGMNWNVGNGFNNPGMNGNGGNGFNNAGMNWNGGNGLNNPGMNRNNFNAAGFNAFGPNPGNGGFNQFPGFKGGFCGNLGL